MAQGDQTYNILEETIERSQLHTTLQVTRLLFFLLSASLYCHLFLFCTVFVCLSLLSDSLCCHPSLFRAVFVFLLSYHLRILDGGAF